MTIAALIDGRTVKQRADIKSAEIAKLNCLGIFEDSKYGLRVEIISLEVIEGGVAVMARAWKNGKPLGFGSGGYIETERFRIFNPPVLVDDPDGNIIKEWIDEATKEKRQRRLKEDPKKAIQDTLIHTINLVGKDGKKIISGSIGNTVSTFYPSMDATVRRFSSYNPGESWNNMVRVNGGTGNAGASTADKFYYIGSSNVSSTWADVRRAEFVFDTSALGDSDDISSVVFSLYGTEKGSQLASSINIVASNPGNPATPANADYEAMHTLNTVYCDTAIAQGSWSTSGYNDFTFNATGIAAISKTGNTLLGTKSTADINDSAVSWADGQEGFVSGYFVDQTGTANDPKLVVTHAGSSPSSSISSSPSSSISSSPSSSVSPSTSISSSISSSLSTSISSSISSSESPSTSISSSISSSISTSISSSVSTSISSSISLSPSSSISSSPSTSISSSVSLSPSSSISNSPSTSISSSVSLSPSSSISSSISASPSPSAASGIIIGRNNTTNRLVGTRLNRQQKI